MVGRLFGIITALLFLILKTLHILHQGYSLDFFDVLLSTLLILVAFWSGKKYDQTKYFSEKDELTDVYNRRFVLKRWATRFTEQERSLRKYFILVVDCDNFKIINDTYGHKAGDEVLKFIATMLTENTRKTDTVSRWGGDEFIVIGESRGENGVNSLVKRLQEEVYKQAKKTNLPISISVGYAFYPFQGRTLKELIKIADERMYKEKNHKKILNSS